MSRINTEGLSYLPKATQLDMAETNSKPREVVFESNIRNNVFMSELNIKILTYSDQEKYATVLAYLQMCGIL